jgi:transposase
MRGPDEQTKDMFSYLSPEERVRQDHPLRAIRRMTDDVLRVLSPRFTTMYSDIGRPSIPPEQLLRALLLQGLYTIRSERLLMEEIDYSVLFRWFIGLSMDEPIWSPTTFSKNRDRLLKADVASAFFDAVVDQAREAGLMSDEHFTVDGTVLEAWASLKSFQRKDAGPTPPPDDPGNPTVNFHGKPGRTTRMRRRPTLMPSSIGRARAKKRSWRISVTSCSTTDTGWWRMCVRRPRPGPANGRRRC